MLKKQKLFFFVIFFYIINFSYSQYTGYELGVLVGPVQMRSDFGLRQDKDTNTGNIGFGAGIMLDINPKWWGHRRDYGYDIYDHIKFRADLSYNKTDLKHYGRYVAASNQGVEADKLRAQRGESKNYNAGIALEYYFLSLKGYSYPFFKVSPYFILGGQFTHSQPGSNVNSASDIYADWGISSINTDTFNTFAINTGVGTRFKINKYSDFLVEAKFQFFSSDWIDGLNHDFGDFNKNNDSLIWLSFGYVYYLN